MREDVVNADLILQNPPNRDEVRKPLDHPFAYLVQIIGLSGSELNYSEINRTCYFQTSARRPTRPYPQRQEQSNDGHQRIQKHATGQNPKYVDPRISPFRKPYVILLDKLLIKLEHRIVGYP